MADTTIHLPVRWYHLGTHFDTLALRLSEVAFFIVDSNCGQGNPVVEQHIAPALAAARQAGMRVLFVHNDLTLVDDPGHIRREVHGTRWGDLGAAVRPPPAERRHLQAPDYSPSIAPRPEEPDFPKRLWSAFHDTMVDYHLRTYGIRTLITAGFSQRACLYQTCVGAVEHNYRVIMLRDGTQSAEYPDTLDPANPEGGWLRFVMLRNFEDIVGYTCTSSQFVEACTSID
jgi:nicotinamidase-related amidase